MDFEELKEDELSVLTKEDFYKLIEASWDYNSLKYVIKINHAILNGTYDLCFTGGRCEIYISNSKLYTFDLTESYNKLTFDNCDVYCNSFEDVPYGIYNNCTIHIIDSGDCLSELMYITDHFLNCIFDPPIRFACPEEGSFIGWKAVKEITEVENQVTPRILKIMVPKDAKRSSAFSEKCRCDKAVPLEVYDLEGNVVKPKGKLYSLYIDLFKIHATPLEYIIGKEVYSDRWDTERFNECSNGIHFFMKMEEAVEYYISECM